MDQIAKFLDTTIGQILIIIVIFAVVYFLGSKLIKFLINRVFTGAARLSGAHKKDIQKRRDTLAVAFVNVWRVLMIMLAGFSLLRIFFTDQQLSPLFASAGIFGVALGFGAQSLVKDFLSGIFIVAENQYRVGDIIEIDGSGGTVERIGSRSTIIRDVDGNVHYFPNGMVQHVVNKTMGYSMARFTIALDPESDIDLAIKIINETGKEISEEDKWREKILEAPSFVFMGDFTATAVNLVVSGKTQPSDQWSVANEMRQRLLEKFDKAGIELGLTAPALAPKKR